MLYTLQSKHEQIMIIYMNIKTNTMKFLHNQIKSREDIKNYIDNLVNNNMMYHFDDDAEDILSNVSGFEEPAFTIEQCKLLDARTREILELDYDYSFEYACSVLED